MCCVLFSSLVQFHPDIKRLQLFSSSLDCGIRLWDLRSSQCVSVLQSHYSAVTSLSFSCDGGTMVRYSRQDNSGGPLGCFGVLVLCVKVVCSLTGS